MTPSPSHIEEERAAFEAWLNAKLGQPSEMWWSRNETRYQDAVTESEWQGWLARASQPVEMPEAMVERGAKAVCESHCADGITWEELCLDPDMEEYVEQERRNAETCLTAALSVLAVKGE